TDVVAALRRRASFSAPFRNSISSVCRPTSRSRAAILASYFLDQLGGSIVVIVRTGLEPSHPQPDQVARNIMALRQAVKGLTGDELLCATWRLKSILCERCLAMAFIL